MVEAVRRGSSLRGVAKKFRVSRSHVQKWVKRAQGNSLGQVNWADRSRAPHHVANRTDPELELAVLECRKMLKETSALGFYGAEAIYESMSQTRFSEQLPCVRTIGRILQRHGILDGGRRHRHQAPPSGWYLPEVALGGAELESFDIIEGLVIEGQGEVEVFTGKALWGPHVAAWPMTSVSAKAAQEKLLQHWRMHGLPSFVQFDNDTRFQGGHNHPDVVGRIVRICLSLGITPVFAPPHESGFQAVIEHFNGLWQQKVWDRFHHSNLADLEKRSRRFTEAYYRRLAQQREAAPARRRFPRAWCVNLQTEPMGQMIYLRRCDANGEAFFLGQRFFIAPQFAFRLIRCEVHFDEQEIRIFRLRRREPTDQPLIKTIKYNRPRRGFRE